ncbi:hypothetical protein [Stackebrandtia soli]|uniref:hypothetical protein n=1 Tax=Stackebrandtia soli TaxID=1892856 RepID=UPI0039E98495
MRSDALLQAGLAPVDSPEGQSISARTYHHPGLAEPVVRLTGDQVALAEDRTMSFLGYSEPEVSEPLARGAIRGLNYPAWALVHDSDNAALALSTLPDLERATKKARTSPAEAERMFGVIADKLPRTHLPSFYEQAGRGFLAADRAYFAGLMFSRARSTETIHALPVDETLRQEVFIEFALAGAVTVKAISEYLAELRKRYTPDEALTIFEKLAHGRIRGGQAPWSALLTQWKELAIAADRDPEAEQQRLLGSILDAPSMQNAPVKLWKAARASLVELARSSKDHAFTLLYLFPDAHTYDTDKQMDFLNDWLSLLEESGAVTTLIESGQTARWLNRAIAALKDGRYKQGTAPPRLLRWLPDFVETCGTVDLSAGKSWRRRYLSTDLAIECLRLGIPLADPPSDAELGLENWATSGHTEIDPLLTDERFKALLHRGLDGISSNPILRHPRFEPALDEWMSGHATHAGSGGLLDLQKSMSMLGTVDIRRFENAHSALSSVDVGEVLRRTLRTGIPQEFTWPAYEEAMAEVGVNASITTSWPIVTVFDERKAIAVGPNGRVAEHEPQLPAGNKRDFTIIYSDGAFFVTWSVRYSESFAYWSTDPAHVKQMDHRWIPSQETTLDFVQLTADGLRLSSDSVLRQGDWELSYPTDTVGDGNSYWVRTWRDGQTFREIDPKTAEQGRYSMPSFYADAALPEEHEWFLPVCSLAALPEGAPPSPLGSRDGLVGFRVSEGSGEFRITGVDGRSAAMPRHGRSGPWGLIDIPGGETPRILEADRGTTIVDEDGYRHWSAPVRSAHLPPLAFWHFTTVRNAETSALLRAADATTATALVEAGSSDRTIKPPKEGPAPTPACDALLDGLGVTDPVLRSALTSIALWSARMVSVRHGLLNPKEPQPKLNKDTIDADALRLVLSDTLSSYGYGSGLAVELRIIDEFLNGQINAETARAEFPYSGHDLASVVKAVPMIAVRAVSAGFDDAERTAARQLLDLLNGNVLLSGDVWLGQFVEDKDYAIQSRNEQGTIFSTDFDHTDSGRRFKVIGRGEPALRPHWKLHREPVEIGWATKERLDVIAERAGSEPVVAIDPGAVTLLSERTGLSPAASTLLLAGMPRINDGGDYLGKEGREALGISLVQAKAAVHEVNGLPEGIGTKLYAAALDDDETILWDQPRFAERLAEAWLRLVGWRVRLDDADVLAAASAGLDFAASRVLRFLLDPVTHPLGEKQTDTSGITNVIQGIRWAYEFLPEGHPVRNGIPQAVTALRAAVASMTSLVSLGYQRKDNLPTELLPDTPTAVPGFDEPALDGDLVVAVPSGDWYMMYYRPSKLGDDAASEYVRSMDRSVMHYFDWLRDTADGIVDRIGTIEVGRYDTDPRACVPELVTEAIDTLGLSEDGATLYLQLLTLLYPTDARIRDWNKWTPKRRKATIAELVDKGLVIEAKRPRAGRSVFIPGDWTTPRAPQLPYETWKKDMYDTNHWGAPKQTTTFPQLFARAWGRVVNGEGPK